MHPKQAVTSHRCNFEVCRQYPRMYLISLVYTSQTIKVHYLTSIIQNHVCLQ